MPVYDEAAPRLWPGAVLDAPYTVPLQRLRSHSLRLSDGHRIGVTVGGRGIPLVVAHGFSFAGGLYVQSLSRLASMGFRVLAVDLAGHGGSAGLGVQGWGLTAYRRFLARVLDELGVGRAVLCGHSLGRRLLAELAAAGPDRAGAELVLVHGAAHSWLLEDPETLRSIVAELLGDGLGRACQRAISAAGLDPATVSLAEMEQAFYAPDALALQLGPAARREELRPSQEPRFSWSRVA